MLLFLEAKAYLEFGEGMWLAIFWVAIQEENPLVVASDANFDG